MPNQNIQALQDESGREYVRFPARPIATSDTRYHMGSTGHSWQTIAHAYQSHVPRKPERPDD